MVRQSLDSIPGATAYRSSETVESTSEREDSEQAAAPVAPWTERQSAHAPPMFGQFSHASGRVLVVVPHRDFWNPDYQKVTMAFTKLAPHIAIEIASSSTEPAQPSADHPFAPPIEPDILLREADPSRYDAVIFTGANPMESVEFLAGKPEHDAAKDFIDGMLDRKKYVMSVCGGSAVLADAGALRNRPAAYNEYAVAAARHDRDVQWDRSNSVVVSGQVITASWPEDSLALVQALSRRLTGADR
jgi:putative intracellular protease/amidase